MTSVFQLYGRPLAASIPLPPLRITGDLEGYTAGEPYEGRLQIIDSIGKCVVEIVESSLPPGSYAFVDNFTKEIVLRWPAYAPPEAMASGVPNGDFEQGNDGSWRFGAGWSIEAGGAETGTYSAVYQNQRGIQSIESNRVPYTPGQSITAACRFQQGASSSGNLVGRILLIWCDVNGNMVPGGEGISWTGGTLIRSGSNGEWRTSEVTGASNHPSVATVAVGFSADRKKQNRLCRVDNFTWNHEYLLGADSDLEYSVTFKVTDELNRVAYWSGSIEVMTGDPQWPFVETLLHFDGANGSTTMTDSTGNLWVANGNAAVSTAQAVFGQSLRCDGNGDYLTCAAGLPNIADKEAFTLEFWFRPSAVAWQLLVGFGGTGATPNLLVNYNHPAAPGIIQPAINGAQLNSSTHTLSINTWYHVCVQRDAGTNGLTRLFINGEPSAVAFTRDGPVVTSSTAYIGAKPAYAGSTIALNGHMDELRYTKGIARYPATGFTPASEPFPDF